MWVPGSRSQSGTCPGIPARHKVGRGHEEGYWCFCSSLKRIFPLCPTPAAAHGKRPRRALAIGTPFGDGTLPPSSPKVQRHHWARMERPGAAKQPSGSHRMCSPTASGGIAGWVSERARSSAGGSRPEAGAAPQARARAHAKSAPAAPRPLQDVYIRIQSTGKDTGLRC